MEQEFMYIFVTLTTFSFITAIIYYVGQWLKIIV